MLIHPFAPLEIVDPEHGSTTLLLGERSKERFGSLADGLGGHPARPDGEESPDDLPVGGDAFERLGQPFRFVSVGRAAEALGRVTLL